MRGEDLFVVERKFAINFNGKHISERQLKAFRNDQASRGLIIDTDITDGVYFPISDQLEEEQRCVVQIMSTSHFVDAKECISFLRSKGAVFLGPAILAVIFTVAKSVIPFKRWIYSFAHQTVYSEAEKERKGWTYLHCISEDDFRLRQAPENRPIMTQDLFLCVLPT